MRVFFCDFHDIISHENNHMDMQPHGHDHVSCLDWQTHPARLVHSHQASLGGMRRFWVLDRMKRFKYLKSFRV